jgi:tRNA G18 (ribose-2'-O)-methylase SpoU
MLKELNRLDIQSFQHTDKNPLIIIADNIRSGMNVGSIFRTCDALAIQKLILCGITPKPPHKEINKTAIGATESVAWEYKSKVEDAIEDLIKKDYCILAIEQTNDSTELQRFKIDTHQSYALIFGNEVNGVSDEAIIRADQCLEVPQFGTKHSFNVSVCAGIVMWEFAKVFIKSDI